MRASGLICTVAVWSLSWGTAQAATSDDGWQFVVAPYIWAAGINGQMGAAGTKQHVNISFSDIVDNLDMAYMFQAEAHKGKFGFVVSPVYMDLTNKDKSPLLSTKVDLTTTIVDGFVTWQAAEGFELLFGARYVNMDGKLRLDTPLSTLSGNASKNWTDAIMGFRFAHDFGQHWVFNMRADIGGGPAGESDLTWSANGQIGYKFGDGGSRLFLGYRAIDYDYEDNGFTFNAVTGGPIVGFAWIF